MAVFNGDYLLDRFTSAVAANALACETYDISEGHYRHLQVKNRIARELENAFKAEGNAFIWENLMAESVASAEPYDSELCKARRYLHIVGKQQQRRVKSEMAMENKELARWFSSIKETLETAYLQHADRGSNRVSVALKTAG